MKAILLSFAFAFAFAVERGMTLGRLPLGIDYGAASRYATLTAISIVAALILLSTYPDGSRAYSRLAVLLGVVTLSLTAMADKEEINIEGKRFEYCQIVRRILKDGQVEEVDKALFERDKLDDITNGNLILKQYWLDMYNER